jgi:electron transfer flavoprotein beta subunit
VNKTKTGIETQGVKHSLNPFDELSIEEAVRLRERKAKKTSPAEVSEILALSAGPAKCADTLRTAMAMGADRAIHIQLPEAGEEEEGSAPQFQQLEPLGVAKLLRAVAEKEGSNLILLGKQAIDDDSGQTGQMLAGLLNWSQATQASKIEINEDTNSPSSSSSSNNGKSTLSATITQETDDGTSTVRARLPAVITTDLRLNEPRYASLPNIMKAKKKPLEKKTLADYGLERGGGGGGSVRSRLRVLRVEEPPARKGGGKVEDVDGLIGRLEELGAL